MRILAVDGNNLAFRSWHAAHGSMSVSGEETGSLHLFVQGLAKHVRDEHPDKVIVCWDSGSSFREKIDPEYKALAGRGRQSPRPRRRSTCPSD
jgi:5'-3' exonuclease